MGVDVDAVAGIGIDFDEETLKKFGLENLMQKLEEAEDYESFFLDFLKDCEHTTYGRSGNAYSGDYYYHLFAEDPIDGLGDFVEDLNKLGIRITRKDLCFIEEVLWW